MSASIANVLHLEDSDRDAELVRERLQRAALPLSIERVSDRREFLARLEGQPWDLILADYHVPGFDGLDALALARQHQPDTPFLFVSGKMGEELAVETLKRGATDYVLKQALTRLPAAIERALAEGRERVERRQAAAALRASEERFRILATSTSSVVWTTDADGSIVVDPPSWRAFTGQSWDECAGAGWLDAVHPDDREHTGAAWRTAVATCTMYRAQYRVRRHDGQYRHVSAQGAPVIDDDTGTVREWVGHCVDVTDRVQAEEALVEADRRKNEFLAILAHELRNPLAPVRTGLELLSEGMPPETTARTLGVMSRQLEHMVRLVDDLLDVSRITRGRIELRREPVQLAAVIEHALDASRPLIERGRHELSTQIADDPVWLDADLTRLSQVVSNLVNNAAKYTPAGGHITVTAASSGDSVTIAVADDGVGIAPEKLDSVFDMFAQLGDEGGAPGSRGGLGIGLTLVRRLAEMHGGSVSAASDGPGRGSTFTVRLPRSAGPAPARAAAMARQEPAIRLRILVVDDNRDGADLLAQMLSHHGHDTELAYDGPSALDAALAFRPDLIFLDLGLPGMSGYTVAERLRDTPDVRDAVIVALTGWGAAADRRKTRDAGFDLHLAKPVRSSQIREILSRLTSAARAPAAPSPAD